jgi:mannose-6-phosphate isomerase-like protein (cupin superfamily)
MRLKDVAEQVGCTVSMLSKIETGRAAPSLRMLHAIVAALGSNIAALFSSAPDQNVVVYRKGDRPIAHVGTLRQGISLERLAPFAPGRVLEGNIHRVMPGADNGGPIRHAGEEIGYVLEGEIEITIGEQTYTLREGDSFFFKSDVEHSYRNKSSEIASVIWINTPPTF